MFTSGTFSIFHHRRQRAFSLIEVTISLGIMAFALTGIVGLLSGSCTVDRAATNDSALTQIIRNVVESLRGQSMDDLVNLNAEDASQRTFYFSADGSPVESSGGSAPRSAIYSCLVQADADSATQSAAASGESSGAVNLVRLHLQIAWPYPSSAPQKKDVYVHVARY